MKGPLNNEEREGEGAHAEKMRYENFFSFSSRWRLKGDVYVYVVVLRTVQPACKVHGFVNENRPCKQAGISYWDLLGRTKN